MFMHDPRRQLYNFYKGTLCVFQVHKYNSKTVFIGGVKQASY